MNGFPATLAEQAQQDPRSAMLLVQGRDGKTSQMLATGAPDLRGNARDIVDATQYVETLNDNFGIGKGGGKGAGNRQALKAIEEKVEGNRKRLAQGIPLDCSLEDHQKLERFVI
jgi:hypothetical protein